MIIDLAKDEAKQNELKKNIGILAITNADEVIAKEILELISQEGPINTVLMNSPFGG